MKLVDTRRRALLALLLPASTVLLLAGGGTAAVAHGPSSALQAPPATPAAVGESEAAARAQAGGKPVAVTAATTASQTLTANPDGSFTLTATAQPTRKLVDGRWTDLDSTLKFGADGRVAPAVATGNLHLSPGGAGPLATMEGGGRSLALTLPFTLPRPTLTGPVATYDDVLPGVDLQVTATTQGGFAEALVIADATAAANPQLSALTMATTATGVTLAADAAGNIAGTDVNHNTVVTAPTPVMWDSAAPAATAATVTEAGTGRKLDARTGLAARSSAAGPGVAAKIARLGVGVSARALTLTPPKSLLASATYPVYVDPSWSWGAAQNGWAVIDDSRPTTKYWKNSPSDQNDMQSGHDPDGSEVRRTLVNFPIDTGKLTKDAVISSATLNITETWSYNCTASKVDIYAPTPVLTSSNAYWNAWDGVALGTRNDQVNAAHGYTSSCPAAGVGFDILTGIKAAAGRGAKTQTFVIKANDESASSGWKRWSPSTPKITVSYDHKPNKPTGLHTSPTTACSGTTVGDHDIKLYATVSDPDGGTVSENFVVWRADNGSVKTTGTMTNVASGSGSTPFTAKQAWLESVAAGQKTTFAWNVTATQNSLTSLVSSTCTFMFDPTRQHAPDVGDIPAATVGSPVTLPITYQRNPGEATVPASYQYQLNAGSIGTVTADANGAATITVTPMRTTNRLTVISVSAGANIGDGADEVFTAALPAPAADADLNGDGNADLVAVGGNGTVPSGVWLATGSGTTTAPTVNTTATNIGLNGNGTSTAGSPADFDGKRVITGRFTGTNLQDLLYYDPATGSGGILAGHNDGSVIDPEDDAQHTISAGILTDYSASGNADEPLMVANTGAASGQDTGFMDLIGIAGDNTDGFHLVYYRNTGGPASYPMSYPLVTAAPDGTNAWNAWTVATAQRADGTVDMFLWNKTTGALWLWAGLAFTTDDNGDNALTYTASVLADGTTTFFQKAATVSLQAADINRDGTADLWTVGSTTTAWLVSGPASGPGTISAQPAQKLNTPTHSWLLNDAETGKATLAHDWAGGLNSVASTGNASFDTGDMFSPDVTFDGVNSGMNTAGSAVATTGDFTISLWTKPDAYSGNVLSQDGSQGTLFKIWPSSDTTWKFAFQKADAPFTTATWDTASSAVGTAKLGFWYHITVTYQASTKRMQLYLNDVPVGSAIRSSTWTYNGKLQFGSMKTATNAWGYYYDGQLANVQTWNSIVNPMLIANWDMGGGSGTTISDWTGYGNTATLAGGYTWNTTGHNSGQNGSVTFNGTTGYAQPTTTLLQPATTSFSVSSWVYLTDSTASTDRVVISQAGTNRAPFYLMYGKSTNSWQFQFSNADVPTNPVLYTAADPTAAARNSWVHLAGTYDAATHTARLYVNGKLVGTATGVTTWNSPGKTWFGRSGASWWQGKLDAVRVYQGVLSDDQVKYVMTTS